MTQEVQDMAGAPPEAELPSTAAAARNAWKAREERAANQELEQQLVHEVRTKAAARG